MQKQMTEELKRESVKANYRSIMIRKRKDTRSKLWQAGHNYMHKYLGRISREDIKNRRDPYIIKKFIRDTYRRCSSRSYNMVKYEIDK